MSYLQLWMQSIVYLVILTVRGTFSYCFWNIPLVRKLKDKKACICHMLLLVLWAIHIYYRWSTSSVSTHNKTILGHKIGQDLLQGLFNYRLPVVCKLCSEFYLKHFEQWQSLPSLKNLKKCVCIVILIYGKLSPQDIQICTYKFGCLSHTCHDIREYLNTTLQLPRVFGGRKNMNIVGQHHVQFFNYCSKYFNNLEKL